MSGRQIGRHPLHQQVINEGRQQGGASMPPKSEPEPEDKPEEGSTVRDLRAPYWG